MRAWAMLAGGALGVLLLLWLGTRLLAGGGDDGSPLEVTGPTGSSGATTAPFADPPPSGSISVVFPRRAMGTRLELKVVALGDDPEACRAEGLRIRDDVRTVYHHRCSTEEEIDRVFFLVRLTNVTASRVPVELAGFMVRGADGVDHEALAAPPVGLSATRFFPLTSVLGPGASLKRWVTIDGSDGVRPGRLVYADGPETLIVRFPDAWI